MDAKRALAALAVVGGVVALIAGAALPSYTSPTYNVAVYESEPTT